MFSRKNKPYIALNYVSGDPEFKAFFRGTTPETPASLASQAVPWPELPPLPKQKFLDGTVRRFV